jgi:hypothetical protein
MYFNHPILGRRLIEITNAFLNIENKSAYEILGDPDYLKMKSCMTLFNSIQAGSDVFSKVINKYYWHIYIHKLYVDYNAYVITADLPYLNEDGLIDWSLIKNKYFIDTYLSDMSYLNLKSVNYIKIDAEGAENLILLGSIETILNFSPIMSIVLRPP